MAMGPPGVLAVMAAEGMVYVDGGLANVLGVGPLRLPALPRRVVAALRLAMDPAVVPPFECGNLMPVRRYKTGGVSALFAGVLLMGIGKHTPIL
jgi:hypothetical protein